MSGIDCAVDGCSEAATERVVIPGDMIDPDIKVRVCLSHVSNVPVSRPEH